PRALQGAARGGVRRVAQDLDRQDPEVRAAREGEVRRGNRYLGPPTDLPSLLQYRNRADGHGDVVDETLLVRLDRRRVALRQRRTRESEDEVTHSTVRPRGTCRAHREWTGQRRRVDNAHTTRRHPQRTVRRGSDRRPYARALGPVLHDAARRARRTGSEN